MALLCDSNLLLSSPAAERTDPPGLYGETVETRLICKESSVYGE